MTEWDVFKKLDLQKIYDAMQKPVSPRVLKPAPQPQPPAPAPNPQPQPPAPNPSPAPHQAFIFDGRDVIDHETARKIGFEVWAVGKSTFNAGANK